MQWVAWTGTDLQVRFDEGPEDVELVWQLTDYIRLQEAPVLVH